MDGKEFNYDEAVEEIARRYGVPKAVYSRMVHQESGGDDSAVSPKGASSRWQIMPATAKGLGIDPADPLQAAEGGLRLLRDNYKRFRPKAQNEKHAWMMSVAGYHGNPNNVEKDLRKGGYGLPEISDGAITTRDHVLKIFDGITSDQFDRNPLGQMPDATNAYAGQPQSAIAPPPAVQPSVIAPGMPVDTPQITQDDVNAFNERFPMYPVANLPVPQTLAAIPQQQTAQVQTPTQPTADQAAIEADYQKWLSTMEGYTDAPERRAEYNALLGQSGEFNKQINAPAIAQDQAAMDAWNRQRAQEIQNWQATRQGQPAVAPQTAQTPTDGLKASIYNIDLSKKQGAFYGEEHNRQVAAALASELNVPFEDALTIVNEFPTKTRDNATASEDYIAQANRVEVGPDVKRRILAYSKEVGDLRRKLSEQTARYQSTLNPDEPPSTAQIRAARDLGLITEADAEKQIKEEVDVMNRLRSESRPWFADGSVIAGVETPEDANIRQKATDRAYIENILKDYGSLAAYKKEQDRLREEYKYRPAAHTAEFVRNLGGAIPKAVASILKTADIALNMNPLKMGADAIQGKDFTIDETILTEIGDKINRTLQAGQNKDLKNNLFVTVLPDTLGQLGVQIAAGALSGGATVPTAIGASMGAAAQYDEAKKFNATEKQKLLAAVVGAAAAVPDAVLFSKWFKANPESHAGFFKKLQESLLARIGVRFGDDIAKETVELAMPQIVRRVVIGSLGEGTQEVSENKINDITAYLGYDPSPARYKQATTLTDEDFVSFLAGAVGGGLAGGFLGKTVRGISPDGTETTVRIDPDGSVKLLKGQVENPDIEMYFNEQAKVWQAKNQPPEQAPVQPREPVANLRENNPTRIEVADPAAVQKAGIDTRVRKVTDVLKNEKDFIDIDQLAKKTRMNRTNLEDAIMTLYGARIVEMLPGNKVKLIDPTEVAKQTDLYTRAQNYGQTPEVPPQSAPAAPTMGVPPAKNAPYTAPGEITASGKHTVVKPAAPAPSEIAVGSRVTFNGLEGTVKSSYTDKYGETLVVDTANGEKFWPKDKVRSPAAPAAQDQAVAPQIDEAYKGKSVTHPNSKERLTFTGEVDPENPNILLAKNTWGRERRISRGDADAWMQEQVKPETPQTEQTKEPWQMTRQEFLKAEEHDRQFRDQYVKDGAVIASSRETPSTVESPKIGSWRIAETGKWNKYGDQIEQLQEIPIEKIKGAEDPYLEGRGADVERYAQWAAEGKKAPPLKASQLQDGTYRISDGHRRVAAAQKAGQKTILAWVSPYADTGRKAADGKIIDTDLTHQLAVQQALDQGKPVPPEVLKDYPDLVKTAPAPSAPKSQSDFMDMEFGEGESEGNRAEKSKDLTLENALPKKLKADTPRSLSQFVRQAGGIRPTQDTSGETRRLSNKETGSTGIVKKTGRYTAEEMAFQAWELGYLRDIWPTREDINGDEFMGYVEADLHGETKHYSMDAYEHLNDAIDKHYNELYESEMSKLAQMEQDEGFRSVVAAIKEAGDANDHQFAELDRYFEQYGIDNPDGNAVTGYVNFVIEEADSARPDEQNADAAARDSSPIESDLGNAERESKPDTPQTAADEQPAAVENVEGRKLSDLSPVERSALRRDLAPKAHQGRAQLAGIIARTYDLDPAELDRLKPLGEVGKFGQTSHVIKATLSKPENYEIYNSFAGIFLPGEKLSPDEFEEFANRGERAAAILDTIAEDAGFDRSSQMDADAWQRVLDRYGYDLSDEAINTILSAIDHQQKWHRNIVNFVNDPELEAPNRRVFERGTEFGWEPIANARWGDVTTEDFDPDQPSFDLKGDNTIKKEILRIGRKYGIKESRGEGGLSDPVIKTAYLRAVRQAAKTELSARAGDEPQRRADQEDQKAIARPEPQEVAGKGSGNAEELEYFKGDAIELTGNVTTDKTGHEWEEFRYLEGPKQGQTGERPTKRQKDANVAEKQQEQQEQQGAFRRVREANEGRIIVARPALESEKPESPSKATESKVAEKADAFTVNPDDIPYNLALAAYHNSSFSPEKRAKQVQEEYVSHVTAVYDEFLPLAKTDEQKAILDAEIERYRQGYVEREKAILSAQSRTASSMITGPANFPAERNRKRLAVVDKRVKESIEWSKKAQAAIEKRLLNARTPEAKADEIWNNFKRGIDQSIEWQSPTNLAGRLERIANNGNVDLLTKALDYIRERQKSLPKPLFTERHSVWQLPEKAASIVKTPAPTGTVTIAEYDGAKVVNNKDIERVQILFDERPSPETIKVLKKSGWRWSPREGAWQRQNTQNGIYNSEYVLNQAGFTKSEPVQAETLPEKPDAGNVNLFAKTTPIPGQVDLWGNATAMHNLQQDLFGDMSAPSTSAKDVSIKRENVTVPKETQDFISGMQRSENPKVRHHADAINSVATDAFTADQAKLVEAAADALDIYSRALNANATVQNMLDQNWLGQTVQITARAKQFARAMERGTFPKVLGEALAGKDLSDTPLFSRYSDAPTFYSQLERTIEQKMPAKASAAQVRGIIKDTKQEERDWLGIDQWLDEHPKVTKEEVLQFVRENNAKIEVVEKGKSVYQPQFDITKSEDTQGNPIWQVKLNGKFLTALKRERFPTEDDVQDYASRHYRDANIRETDDTKFSQYVLPGGENYREMLLTLPKNLTREESVADQMRSKYGQTWLVDMNDADRKAYLTAAANDTKADNFQSSHFSEPNILVHIRFDDRTVDGKKILHIAEIQSDWHQAGRKKGYSKTNRDISTIPLKASQDADGTWIVSTHDGETIVTFPFNVPSSASDAILMARESYRHGGFVRQQSAVPDAPFKKSWHELALKKMLRYAAENGYDAVSWDTGETQADRYDLSKHLNGIEYWDDKDNTYGLRLQGKNGDWVDGKQRISADKLEDYVGKEMAQKIVDGDGVNSPYSDSDTPGEYKWLGNLDLKVGGEGMKGFYDKILPAFANKYTKKWGGKTSLTRINATDAQDTSNIIIVPTYNLTDLPRRMTFAKQSDRGLHIELKSGLPKSSQIQGARSNADFFPDLDKWHTGGYKFPSQIPIPVLTTVMDRVRSMVHDREIGKAIVSLVPVDVMDSLIGQKGATEMLLHNPSVLANHLVPDADGEIPVAAIKALTAIVTDPTFPITEVVLGSDNLVDGTGDVGRAKSATDSFHGFSPAELVASITENSKVGNTPVHRLDITPAMRESVMQGQPLFNKPAMAAETKALNGEIAKLLKKQQKGSEYVVADATFDYNPKTGLIDVNAAGLTVFQAAIGAFQITGATIPGGGYAGVRETMVKGYMKLWARGKTDAAKKLESFILTMDASRDPESGAVAISLADPKYPTITKYSAQEESGHLADMKAQYRYAGLRDAEPFIKADAKAYATARRAIMANGYPEKLVHPEFLGKIQRDDAAEELNLTQEQVDDFRDIRLLQLKRAGMSSTEFVDIYGKVSESNKRSAEKYASQYSLPARSGKYEREAVRDESAIPEGGGGRERSGSDEGSFNLARTSDRPDRPQLRLREVPEADRGLDKLRETALRTAERSSDQTETPDFAAWFKNSKVVDENGKPLVVYHGSDAERAEFRPTAGKRYSGLKTDLVPQQASFFAKNREYAEEHGDVVTQAYLKLENPIDFRGGIDESFDSQLLKIAHDKIAIYEDETSYAAEDAWQLLDSPEAVARIKELGHDGAIMLEEGGNGIFYETYAVFEPTQIKSAIGNRGTFDANDPNILHSKTDALARRTAKADLAKIREAMPESDILFARTPAPTEAEISFFKKWVLNPKTRETSIKDIVVNFRRAGLLTGPKTHLRNMLSNAINQGTEEAARIPAWIADIAASTQTGERAVQFPSVPALAKSFRSLVVADETLKALDQNSGVARAWHLLKNGSIEELAKNQVQEMKSGVPLLDMFVNSNFRLLGAEDALFKTFALRRSLEEQAKTQAQTESKNLSAHLAEGDRGKFVRERTADLLKNPTKAMLLEGMLYADFVTYTNDNPISDLFKQVKDLNTTGKAVLEIVVPYDRTPTNIVLRALEHTPAGLIWAGKHLYDRHKGKSYTFDNLRKRYADAYEHMDANREAGRRKVDAKLKDALRDIEAEIQNAQTPAEKDFWKNEKKRVRTVQAKLKAKRSLKDSFRAEDRQEIEDAFEKIFPRVQQKMFAMSFGRATMGSAVLMLGFYLASKGLMSGFWDPSEYDESDEFYKRRDAGILNGALTLGNRRYQINDTPTGKVMVLGASMWERSQRKPKKGETAFDKLFRDTTDVGGETIMEQPLLNSLDDYFGKSRSVQKRVGGLLGSFVPTILADVADLTDTSERTRRNETLYDPALNRIPGARQSLPESKYVRDPYTKQTGTRILNRFDPTSSRPVIAPKNQP